MRRGMGSLLSLVITLVIVASLYLLQFNHTKKSPNESKATATTSTIDVTKIDASILNTDNQKILKNQLENSIASPYSDQSQDQSNEPVVNQSR